MYLHEQVESQACEVHRTGPHEVKSLLVHVYRAHCLVTTKQTTTNSEQINE